MLQLGLHPKKMKKLRNFCINYGTKQPNRQLSYYTLALAHLIISQIHTLISNLCKFYFNTEISCLIKEREDRFGGGGCKYIYESCTVTEFYMQIESQLILINFLLSLYNILIPKHIGILHVHLLSTRLKFYTDLFSGMV